MGSESDVTPAAAQTGHFQRTCESLRVRLRDWLMQDSAAEREMLAFMHRNLDARMKAARGGK